MVVVFANIALSSIVIGILFIVVIALLFVYVQKNRAIKELDKQNVLVVQQKKEIVEKNNLLRLQNKELEELNEEKNNIIGIVSHDLKAPLNRIFALSNLLMLSGDNLNEEQKEYLEKMNYVVKDGMDLIRNLLDIRAIELKGIVLNVEPVNIYQLMEKLVRSYESSSTMKNQKLELKSEGESGQLLSDKLYLNRIFDNLVSNAIKFSPPGGSIEIIVSYQEEKVLVSVKDSGPGISDEEQSKLFKKFMILTPKPTAGESSTGLGLSIAKSLVEMLSGRIWCISELRKGSTFFVELPYEFSSK